MEESRSGDPCRDMTDVFAVLAKKRVYIETLRVQLQLRGYGKSPGGA